MRVRGLIGEWRLGEARFVYTNARSNEIGGHEIDRRRPILAGISKKLALPKPAVGDIHRVAAKLRPLSTVEAPDEATVIAKAGEQFKTPATKLVAVPRR